MDSMEMLALKAEAEKWKAEAIAERRRQLQDHIDARASYNAIAIAWHESRAEVHKLNAALRRKNKRIKALRAALAQHDPVRESPPLEE